MFPREKIVESRETCNDKRQVRMQSNTSKSRVNRIDTSGEGMPITRLFPDENGQSHETDEDVEMDPADDDALPEEDDTVYDGGLFMLTSFFF